MIRDGPFPHTRTKPSRCRESTKWCDFGVLATSHDALIAEGLLLLVGFGSVELDKLGFVEIFWNAEKTSFMESKVSP